MDAMREFKGADVYVCVSEGSCAFSACYLPGDARGKCGSEQEPILCRDASVERSARSPKLDGEWDSVLNYMYTSCIAWEKRREESVSNVMNIMCGDRMTFVIWLRGARNYFHQRRPCVAWRLSLDLPLTARMAMGAVYPTAPTPR